MNRIKGSWIAKLVAWLVAIVSGTVCIVSVVATAYCYEAGLYTNTWDAVKDDLRSALAYKYAILIMGEYADDNMDGLAAQLDGTSVRYGIIKTSDLDSVNLNNASVYEARNFTGKVDKNQFYSTYFGLDADGAMYDYEWESRLFGECYYSISHDDEYTRYADLICYDTATGRFYYHATDDLYYPAHSVMIYFKDDAAWDAAWEISAETGEEVNVVETSEYFTYDAEKKMYLDQSGVYLTFDELDGTTRGQEYWDGIVFEDVRYLEAEQLTLVENLSADSIVNDVFCYLDDNYTLHVQSLHCNDYTVIVYADESVLAEEKADYQALYLDKWLGGQIATLLGDKDTDLFVLYELWQETFYNLKEEFATTAVVTALLTLASVVFLMCGAGHRRNREEIVLTFMDKMPFDVLTVLMMMAETGLVCAFAVPLTGGSLFGMQLGFFAGIIAFCVFVWYFLSAAVRVKAGKWWKNTICWKILAWLGKWFGICVSHVGLAGKTAVVIGACVLADLMYLSADGAFPLFVLKHLVLAVALIWFVRQLYILQEGSRRLAAGDLDSQVDTSKLHFDMKEHGENLNSVSAGMARAVDERMKSEHFKTELITNVSHDIKTPLTSIINYVDLLAKTEVQDETQREYLEVLTRQSARLKKLIEDLIEASKASTGNLPVNTEHLQAEVFLEQIVGEYEEKLSANRLELIVAKPDEPIYIDADGRHLWRVVDNLMNNICKYAQPDSRVYINLEKNDTQITLTFRNMSRYALNISGDELMERFVRGDSSRNTDGNGLGLSIAASLMELMHGTMKLYVDGDLFKVVLGFAVA